MRKSIPIAAAAAALALAIAVGAGQPATSVAGGAANRPNVIVILTDDQTVAELTADTMPQTVKHLAEPGTSFTQSIVSSPLCCPSRAGFLTGQYPHNSGVIDNEPGYAALIDKTSVLPAWLQAAGYRTGYTGRFLLNYEREQTPPSPLFPATDAGYAAPPGVEDWYGYVGSQAVYYGAPFSDNGVAVSAGTGPAGYSTRVINRAALDFVQGAKADPRPFFLQISHLAPHSSNTPAPGTGPCGEGGLPIPEDAKAYRPFQNLGLPKPESFDEQKIADKPDWVATRPPLGHTRRHNLKLGYRCALSTLSTVDRGVGELVKQLERQGELDNTAIFFTSDNGYFFGEHRIYLNKVFPYEEALRVPLLARVPPSLLGRDGPPPEVSAPVNNLDLTATILDLAGAAPCNAEGACRTLDGRSFRPLLKGERPDWSRGRTLLYQLGGNRTCGVIPTERGLNNFYDALRTKRYVYVELDRVNKETGICDRPEYELYDLKRDPNQLRNQAVNPAVATPSELQTSLAARLDVLRACAGVSGRDPVASRPFCE